MRIAILLNARFPTEKAYGIQVLAMARGFRDSGHDVAIVFPRRSRTPYVQDTGIDFIPFGTFLHLSWGWVFHLARILGALQSVSVLKKWKSDVVLVNDPVQAAFLGSKMNVVWDVHDTPNPKSIWRRILIQYILKKVKGIVSTNNLKIDVLKNISQYIPLYIVLPNPVSFDISIYRNIHRDDARQKLGISLTEKIVVYAGQLYDWKGVDTLILAGTQIDDIRIHIVGGQGSDLERCKKIAGKNIIFHGMQKPEMVPYWLRAADIVAVPNSGKFEVSIRDTNPLKLYEALAAESAIIASDLPSLHEATGNSGAVKFVEADNVEAWGSVISTMMSDVMCIMKMRDAAHHFPRLVNARERAEASVCFFRNCV